MGLAELKALSNRYGANPDYVLGGGGNTSYKEGNTLFVKASGKALADITSEGFVAMNLKALTDLAGDVLEGTDREVEAEVLRRMMDARLPGEEAKRPSVEAMLHALFPETYVLHLHPALINGITCAKGGRITAEVLFGREMLWIPEIKPGYTLANRAQKDMEKFREEKGEACHLLFLENHGVFFAADTVEELDALFERVYKAVASFSYRPPDVTPLPYDQAGAEELGRELLTLTGAGAFSFGVDRLLLDTMSSGIFETVTDFTPDHIVYCKARTLLTEEETAGEDIKAYQAKMGFPPVIVGLPGKGVFAFGKDKKAADNALAVLRDAAKIAYYAEGSGGMRLMSDFMVNFITHWEVESYRAKAAN